MKAADKLLLIGWGCAQLIRLGRPDLTLGFLGGIGDDLLCTAPIEEWRKRGAKRIWFITRHPNLYRPSDGRVKLVPEDPRVLRLAMRIGRAMRALSYSEYDGATDRDSSLTEHCLVTMCRRAGLTGRIQLRPHLRLTPEELSTSRQWQGCLAVQTSTLNAIVPMRTKQWAAEKMQRVVDALEPAFKCVQIGSADDPPLRGVIDLRGHTSLRETAAVLHHARLFVGLVGFLMHLARAVDCPAVIVYGGRENPEFTGYPCNVNVVHKPPCSPCWQRSRCEFGYRCMEEVSSDLVIAGVRTALAAPRFPLETHEATL